MRKVIALGLACAALHAGMPAHAQGYPEAGRTVRFVIGFPAGSSIDNVSRIVTDDIRARTGAVIVVENRAGALGALGVDAVARAAPDGYTMMPSSSATSSSGPFLSKAIQKHDALADFTQVARMVRFDVVVVTRAAGGHADARSLIAAGRAKPKSLATGYGSGTGQVASAAFSRAAGMEVLSVPYKGQPAAVTDLLGGRVDFVSSDLGAVLPQIGAHNLHAIALVSNKRSTILPDVPTAAELGLSGLDLTGWIGVAGPARLPAQVVQWWQDQLKLSLNKPEVKERLRGMGMETDFLAGDDFQRFVRAQYEEWGAQIRHAGIQAE
ncbi:MULTISPECIES: tripartite tricarboxylate transporter substrate binding protein [unclassified Pigmentiphaga]|uniref:Bug family tripartite tricarboxylate transporter substrate binding protein n=1 Tax=unclassified Pigmentiphaga TaxID=2626614 RepID=UPI000B40FB92|nr:MULTISPECIES: tripartite tricarboxylate transporter substrate binding protein [unclassified Pigmentiphaga]OVZ64537.1 hypothetical protein CDO46_08090 [Pigmentiphaga sp. NML030171]